MAMLDKRLNDKPKNWRHVFKVRSEVAARSTVRLMGDFTGSCRPRLLAPCRFRKRRLIFQVGNLLQKQMNLLSSGCLLRDNIYAVSTLKEFQFIDQFQRDQGANVRQKAKDVTNVLQDDARLRQERKTRATMRDRFIGHGNRDYPDESQPRRSESTDVSDSARPKEDHDQRTKNVPPRRGLGLLNPVASVPKEPAIAMRRNVRPLGIQHEREEDPEAAAAVEASAPPNGHASRTLWQRKHCREPSLTYMTC